MKKCLPSCTSPTSRTVYIYAAGKDVAEYDNGAAPGSPSREYIYSGELLLATLTSTSTTYHHFDHLSVRLSTDTSGSKIGEQGHFPYGEAWYTANTTTKFIFTSYERDSESGNDYAMARYYHVRFGRFCSADPVMGNPVDPQSWNRYVYVRDNPVGIVDPAGMGWLSAFFNFLAGVFALPQSIGQTTPPFVPAPSPGLWERVESSLENMFIPPLSGSTPPIFGLMAGTNDGSPDNASSQIADLRSLLLSKLVNDGDCLSFLNRLGGQAIKTLKSVPINYGPLPSGLTSEAETTPEPSDVPYSPVPADSSITINSNGDFFKRGQYVDGGPLGPIQTGTQRYEGLVVLHELGHATGALHDDSEDYTRPNGTLTDYEALNDYLIEHNCAKTLGRLSNK